MHYGALPKKTSIKGQPHELSYITPQEAGVLRMLGGAGKNVNGVPAYYHTSGHAGGGGPVSYGDVDSDVSRGYQQAVAGGYRGAGSSGYNNNNDKKPKKQSEQTIMELLRANNAKARAEREAAAATEAALAEQTLAGSNVSPTSTVQMKDGKVLVSTNVGSGTENTYLDPDVYTTMTGYEPPTSVGIQSSDNVSSPMLDATKPVDTTGFVEDVMAAGSDIAGVFSGDPLGNEGQSYYIPGYGSMYGNSYVDDDGNSISAMADAYNKVEMLKFDQITPDDPLFDINPANVLTEEDLFNMRGEIDPVTGNVDSGGQGNYGDDVSVPYDYYGAPFGLGYDDNGNLVEIPLGDGITIPGTDITITAPPTDDGGGGAPPSGGSFSKKRDVYGNPIRLTKGGASWWKMAANWMNPSERIDTFVTVDDNDNYITSEGELVPPELIATALLTPTDLKIKTGTEEYQVPYSGISNMPTDYNALYSGEINQEPLPVLQEQQVLNVSDPIIKP